MTETAAITTSLPIEVKRLAEKLFADLGMDINQAISRFIYKSLRIGDLPCDLPESDDEREAAKPGAMPFIYDGELRWLVPNAETLEAIQGVDDMIAGRIPKIPIDDLDAFFAEVKAEAELESETEAAHAF